MAYRFYRMFDNIERNMFSDIFIVIIGVILDEMRRQQLAMSMQRNIKCKENLP